MSDPNKLYTLRDVANLLQVSTRTIQMWIKRGFPHVVVGGSLRFRSTEIERIVREGWIPHAPKRRGRPKGSKNKSRGEKNPEVKS